ncbi:MAG: STM3941 family protein [Niabella sp.]
MSHNTNEQIIYHNPAKTRKRAAIAIVCLIIGILITSRPHWFIKSDNISVILYIGYGIMVIAAVVAFLSIRKILVKSPALVLDDEGFTDSTAGKAYYKVNWKDVRAIELKELYQQYFISVKVKNPDFYLQKENNPIRLRLMQMNQRLYETPIHIAAHALDMDAQDLQDLLSKRWTDYKSVQNRK